MLGGVFGALGSLLGGIDTVILLTNSFGLNASVIAYAYPAQLSVSLEMLFVGALIALSAGLPLGMAGSIGGILETGDEVTEATPSV